jgi:hypothetical protein
MKLISDVSGNGVVPCGPLFFIAPALGATLKLGARGVASHARTVLGFATWSV